MYLEQVIMKSKAHIDASNIKERADGLDFYFNTKSDVGRRRIKNKERRKKEVERKKKEEGRMMMKKL